MSTLFDDVPTNPSLSPPIELVGDGAENTFKRKVYFELFKQYLSDCKTLINNLHSLFSIIWGQCSTGVQSKLKGKVNFLIKKEDGNCAWLLEEIRQAMFNFSSGRYMLKSMFEAKLDILKFKQGRLQLAQYFDRYLQQIHTFEHHGGSIGQDPGLLNYVDQWNEDVIDAHPGDAPAHSRDRDS